MPVGYLEFVTAHRDEVCATYTRVHGVPFSDPVPELGNARVGMVPGMGRLGIREPLRPDETPVVRPYLAVEDVNAALAKAKDAGAEVAVPATAVPGQGTIGIFIQGGIESGLWQDT